MPTPSSSTSSSSSPSTPDWTPPSQDASAADAEALQRASDRLAEAGKEVAGAREQLSEAAKDGGGADAATQAAEQALADAEAALADASEQLDAAAAGGGDPGELNEAVRAAEEALAAAEDALAAAEAAGAGADETQLADAGGAPGEEEPLPAAEDTPAGGGDSLPGAEDRPAGGGQPVVVAVAGAQGALGEAQAAVADAVRALIITGVYLPPGGSEDDPGGALPSGGVIVLMPGEPGQDQKVAELEGQLDGSLVVFDGRLLAERERLASQRTSAGSGIPGGEEEETDIGADAAALLEELGGAEPGAEGEALTDAEMTGEVASTEDMGAGKRETHTQRPSDIPEGVPDGKDDDIVARQIREAAMNETDPVLREKLWREYIRYKQGGG